jgi:hypothetical protein
MKLNWDEGTRYLEIDHRDHVDIVKASNETGNPARRLESKTWNFDQDGKHYRVQIQVTSPEEGK